MKIRTPAKLKGLWEPYDYKILYGGRGSGKSWGVGDYLIASSLMEENPGGMYLCGREYQTSMDDSVYSLLKSRIQHFELDSEFSIGRSEIICIPTDTKFSFLGIRRNPQSVKSMYNIRKLWLEEAQTVSKESLEILLPTIREEGSEAIFTYNPFNDDDPVHQMMLDPYPNTWIQQLNWRDNPWFTERMRLQMEKDREKDLDLYNHVWEGHTYNRSEAQIFWKRVKVAHFQPLNTWNGPYYGLDWGFSNDPLAMVRVWVADNRLFIEREAFKHHLDLHKTVEFLKKQDPYCDRYTIRADNARPESISYVQQHGLPKVVPAAKGPNSLEEGITNILSYDDIIIHPDCVNMIEEARKYSYKVDKMTGDVLPFVVDAHNHGWDAVRYALEPLLPKRGQKGGIVVRRTR